MIGQVKVSEDIMKIVAQMSIRGNCAGHRAELALVETAKAIASFDNRKNVTADDLQASSELVLPHRIRDIPPPYMDDYDSEEEQEDNEYDNGGENSPNEEENLESNHEKQTQEDNDEYSQDDDQMTDQDLQEPAEGGDSNEDKPKQYETPNLSDEEIIEEPGEVFQIRPLNIEVTDRKNRRGTGKRARTNTNSNQGRYIRYTFPKGKLKDLAFDATLRAAAPFQKSRKSNEMAVSINSSDFREKVREKRTGSTILFIVDASGSMGARQRMKAVKGAILSILNDVYQKRDKVGMIAFRKDTAEIILEITRSVDLAQKSLKELPTGGKTPLAKGLYSGYELLKAAKLKDPEMIPMIVLVSDGRANVGLSEKNPVDDALKIASQIASEGIKSLVIDTEKDFIKLELASKIAKAMDAEYYKLEELERQEIEFAVKSFAL